MLRNTVRRFYNTLSRTHKIHNRIRMETLRKEHSNDLVDIVSAHFVAKNPMARQLQLSPQEVAPWFDKIVRKCMERPEVSLKMFDHETDNFIGLRLNSLSCRTISPLERDVEKQVDGLRGNAKILFSLLAESRWLLHNRSNDEINRWIRIEVCILDDNYKNKGLDSLLLLGGINYDDAFEEYGIQGVEFESSTRNHTLLCEKLGFRKLFTTVTEIDNARTTNEVLFLDTTEP